MVRPNSDAGEVQIDIDSSNLNNAQNPTPLDKMGIFRARKQLPQSAPPLGYWRTPTHRFAPALCA